MPMTKKILFALTIAMALNFVPVLLNEANARIELTDFDLQQPSIRQSGSTLIINGAVGKTVYVYNLLGVQLAAIHIDSQEKRVDLSSLPRGIYPIKIGNFTKKIQL